MNTKPNKKATSKDSPFKDVHGVQIRAGDILHNVKKLNGALGEVKFGNFRGGEDWFIFFKNHNISLPLEAWADSVEVMEF